MTTSQIKSILHSFRSKRIAVIGDIMLDKYIFGHVSRISPEYPVPVVDVTHEDSRLGGAANVALNTLSLGAETILIGITGADSNREILLDLFRNHGLATEGLICDPSRPTTSKTRILSQNHHITRVDFESRKEIDAEIERAVFGSVEAVIDSVDAIVLEDYNKGLLGAQLIQKIITSAKSHNVPVLVDPKHQNFFAYKGCTIFKPNLSEMAASLGIILHNNDREVEDACLLLQKKLEAEAIIVTRSDKGMTVYNGTFTHIDATSLEVADVSGAGDTVIGILALGTAAHIDIVTNAIIANLAAGTVCQEVGAVPVNPEKLLKVYQEYLQQ
ncbi:D-glycero-beta-D-manno-heptose-7-phosphate kinase [Pelodictyon phaeoclathratiforme]|uniref:RfaE bifunctional protein n=1 Tax=Pelodictyon phaeoclathratiforme (strain DSM 5477 / BU-1) TaxID=324925 RepID=B4SA48_PELPB|nr:D-glycero-beta-D-manno-heptose-7-phosphate kinase [Pelodictyon phaeoclathratiforme]ACF43744.1 rfaE bifunctional protein [Pelodictyon phaeoclathratiforme BU-1]MBV5289562.1 D-glycero-beta-D-manno-heptose-7-phosphate kinase [Pelodictyon phaeoclathratiforme]